MQMNWMLPYHEHEHVFSEEKKFTKSLITIFVLFRNILATVTKQILSTTTL